MKAHKLPSGSYRVQVYDKTTKKYKSFTAPSEDEAIYQAEMYKLQSKHKSRCGYTIGECIDKYIESKSNILSPTTIRGYIKHRKTTIRQ